MGSGISRRMFAQGLAAALAVVGFDTQRRSWATAHDLARHASTLAEDFPHFDGQLLTDDAALTAAADDFGHIVHHRPSAVLLPGSVDDIVTLVQFAGRHAIQVAARGQGTAPRGKPRWRQA